MTDLEKMVTLMDACRQLGLPYASVYRALRDHKIPFKNIARLHMVDINDVRKWAEANPRPSLLTPNK
jgi:Helix-turn-helix domain